MVNAVGIDAPMTKTCNLYRRGRWRPAITKTDDDDDDDVWLESNSKSDMKWNADLLPRQNAVLESGATQREK